MIRLFFLVLGFFFVLFGIIGIVSPIPFGFLFLAIGLGMMLGVSPGLRSQLRKFRARHPNFDRKLHAVEERLPSWFAIHLKKSRPQDRPRRAAESEDNAAEG